MSDALFKVFLREFRLFRDAALGRLNSLEAGVAKLTVAVVELDKTVKSVPGLVDNANDQGQNMRVLDARLKVVEEDTGRKRKNGGHAR